MFKSRSLNHEDKVQRNAQIARFYPQTAETYTTAAFIYGWRSLLYSVVPLGLHELVGDTLAGGVPAEVGLYGCASIPLAVCAVKGLNSAVCAVRRRQLTAEPVPAPEYPQQVAPIPQPQIDAVPGAALVPPA